MRAEFTDDLLTGSKMIDDQHRELIDRINALLDAIESDAGEEEAERTIEFLSEYVDYHFAEEEKLQEEIGYPGIKEHKAKHAEFQKTVADLKEKFESGETENFSELVKEEVIDWLFYHIQTFDRSVGEYRFMRENLA